MKPNACRPGLLKKYKPTKRAIFQDFPLHVCRAATREPEKIFVDGRAECRCACNCALAYD
jgi:hypothetical protein